MLIEPGRITFGVPDAPRNFYRLAFSSIDEQKIEPGIPHPVRPRAALTRNEALQSDNRALATLCVLTGVGLASAQDAVVKYMSSGYPAYETLLFRCVGSLPVIAFILWREGRGWSHRHAAVAARAAPRR